MTALTKFSCLSAQDKQQDSFTGMALCYIKATPSMKLWQATQNKMGRLKWGGEIGGWEGEREGGNVEGHQWLTMLVMEHGPSHCKNTSVWMLAFSLMNLTLYIMQDWWRRLWVDSAVTEMFTCCRMLVQVSTQWVSTWGTQRNLMVCPPSHWTGTRHWSTLRENWIQSLPPTSIGWRLVSWWLLYLFIIACVSVWWFVALFPLYCFFWQKVKEQMTGTDSYYKNQFMKGGKQFLPYRTEKRMRCRNAECCSFIHMKFSHSRQIFNVVCFLSPFIFFIVCFFFFFVCFCFMCFVLLLFA